MKYNFKNQPHETLSPTQKTAINICIYYFNLFYNTISKDMTYKEFIKQQNKLYNLYIIVRISDGKEISRGASFNTVYFLVSDNPHLYKIYFY